VQISQYSEKVMSFNVDLGKLPYYWKVQDASSPCHITVSSFLNRQIHSVGLIIIIIITAFV